MSKIRDFIIWELVTDKPRGQGGWIKLLIWDSRLKNTPWHGCRCIPSLSGNFQPFIVNKGKIYGNLTLSQVTSVFWYFIQVFLESLHLKNIFELLFPGDVECGCKENPRQHIPSHQVESFNGFANQGGWCESQCRGAWRLSQRRILVRPKEIRKCFSMMKTRCSVILKDFTDISWAWSVAWYHWRSKSIEESLVDVQFRQDVSKLKPQLKFLQRVYFKGWLGLMLMMHVVSGCRWWVIIRQLLQSIRHFGPWASESDFWKNACGNQAWESDVKDFIFKDWWHHALGKRGYCLWHVTWIHHSHVRSLRRSFPVGAKDAGESRMWKQLSIWLVVLRRRFCQPNL